MPLTDYIRTYWPIFSAIVSIAVALVMHVTLTNARVADLEKENDRQDAAVTLMQAQISIMSNDVTGMKSDIRSISESVIYIRNRIDKATQ